MNPARKRAHFEQMVMPHLNAAYNLAHWLTRNSHDADDLVQEAYLKAFRSFETFQGHDSDDGRAWLLAVVRNTCFTWLRRKGEHTAAEFDEQLHSMAQPTPNVEATLLNRAALASLRIASKPCRSNFAKPSFCASLRNCLIGRYPGLRECRLAL